MNALAEDFADTIERECAVLSFASANHEAKLQRQADLHRQQAAEIEQRIAQTKRDLRKAVASFEAEIAEIELKITEAQLGAAKSIEAHEKLLTATRAFIAASE